MKLLDHSGTVLADREYRLVSGSDWVLFYYLFYFSILHKLITFRLIKTEILWLVAPTMEK